MGFSIMVLTPLLMILLLPLSDWTPDGSVVKGWAHNQEYKNLNFYITGVQIAEESQGDPDR